MYICIAHNRQCQAPNALYALVLREKECLQRMSKASVVASFPQQSMAKSSTCWQSP